MGDPSDFALGKPKLTVPKEFWDSLDNMAVIVERILTHYGADMNRRDLAARQKELAQAHRMLDKYRYRTRETP